MAKLLLSNPETFDFLVQNNISLFHGTKSTALPKILKYGLKSVDDLSSLGENVSTGEKWSRFYGQRNFISFTDDIDTSLYYASKEPYNDFGIIIGISPECINKLKTVDFVQSDLVELGISSSIPLEYIKFIGTAEKNVFFIKKLIGNRHIAVLPVNIKNKHLAFSYRSYLSNYTNELKKISYNRKQSDINKIFNKLKDKILRKDTLINEQNTRD